jgi:hypothetical protein
MPERWQTDLAKLRKADFGDDLWDRVVQGPRLEPVRPPSRSRALAATVALAVFAAAGMLTWNVFRPLEHEPPTLGASNVVRVPPRGQAVAAFLDDGHPVFVVHQPDGLVVAVDALSQVRDFGIEQLVAWCPDKQYFVTWPDGSFFHRSGRWWGGRPAPQGLRAVLFDVLSRDAAGDPTILRLRQIGVAWGGAHGNLSTQRTFPSACGLAQGDVWGVLMHPIDPSSIWRSPAAAAQADISEWIEVEGQLLVSPDGSVSLCAQVDGSMCRDGAAVRGLDGRRLFAKVLADPSSRFALSRTWLARASGGAFVELAMLPEPTS